MSRVPRRRQWTDPACYHLMDRGHNRETVFRDDADRAFFLGLVARYQKRFAFLLYQYCLMSNHFHLLVQLADPRHLSPLMAGLLRAYVHYFNRRYGFVGHLWQGRFKSPAIKWDGSLLSCGRYIERNPLQAGLVGEPWQYPWSSCRWYALGQSDPWVSANPLYAELAESAVRRQQLWRDFLLGDDPREAAVQRGEWAVGDESFRDRLQSLRGRPLTQRRRGRPRKRSPECAEFRSN